MQEIKCPKCGEIFQVDESGYAAILKQVRDKEFEKEITSQKNQFETEKENAIKLATIETEQDFKDQLNKKDLRIAELEASVLTCKKETELAVSKAVTELRSLTGNSKQTKKKAC